MHRESKHSLAYSFHQLKQIYRSEYMSKWRKCSRTLQFRIVKIYDCFGCKLSKEYFIFIFAGQRQYFYSQFDEVFRRIISKIHPFPPQMRNVTLALSLLKAKREKQNKKKTKIKQMFLFIRLQRQHLVMRTNSIFHPFVV